MVQHKILTHYDDNDIRVRGQITDGTYFLHLDVWKYSHTVQKKIDQIFEQMKQAAKEAGFPKEMYAILENEKYAYYMGGTRINTVVKPSGKELGVFKWEIL